MDKYDVEKAKRINSYDGVQRIAKAIEGRDGLCQTAFRLWYSLKDDEFFTTQANIAAPDGVFHHFQGWEPDTVLDVDDIWHVIEDFLNLLVCDECGQPLYTHPLCESCDGLAEDVHDGKAYCRPCYDFPAHGVEPQ